MKNIHIRSTSGKTGREVAKKFFMLSFNKLIKVKLFDKKFDSQ